MKLISNRRFVYACLVTEDKTRTALHSAGLLKLLLAGINEAANSLGRFNTFRQWSNQRHAHTTCAWIEAIYSRDR